MWCINYTKHCLRCTFHRSMRNRVLKANEAFLKSYPYGKLTDPQAEPLMNALRSRGLKVAVASSSAAPDIMKMLTEGGLKAMVDFAFSGEDCAAHKPAPDIYLKALKALGLTADKAIAVEDSPTGIASAKAAGLKVLALKPRHGEPLDQSAADCIITQLMDVKEHLD